MPTLPTSQTTNLPGTRSPTPPALVDRLPRTSQLPGKASSPWSDTEALVADEARPPARIPILLEWMVASMRKAKYAGTTGSSRTCAQFRRR